MCKNGSVWPTVVYIILVVATFLSSSLNATASPPNLQLTSPPIHDRAKHLTEKPSLLSNFTDPGSHLNDSFIPQCSANETCKYVVSKLDKYYHNIWMIYNMELLFNCFTELFIIC